MKIYTVYNAIKHFLLSVVFLCFAFFPAKASHLAGSDLTYIFVDSAGGMYHYRVTLSINQDSLNGDPEANAEDNPALLNLYTGAGVFVKTDSVSYLPSGAYAMPITAYGICDSGGTTAAIRINRKTFVLDYYLAPCPTGYFITYQRCCLNAPVNIVTPVQVGMSCFVTIPPVGTTTHNNSAVFTNYPPLIIGNNSPFVFDCSATDADGDSLSYALCTPYAGGTDNNAKPNPTVPPFTPVNYTPTLSYMNPMSCSVPLTINPVTGLLTGTPNSMGLYLVDVSCKEWRNGVLLNTVQREFEFTVANCIMLPGTRAKENITLYPNPPTTELSIISTQSIKEISITSLTGKVFSAPATFTPVLGNPNDLRTATIDISGLPPGVYFVNVNGSVMKKFVKG